VIVEPLWLSIAEGELGVKEISGDEHHPRILEYHSTTALASSEDETPWCSAFVNWVMGQAGHVGTAKANARSWMSWGQELTDAAHGCVGVLWRVSPRDWRGHVGFLVGIDSEHVYLLGGNQRNSVSIQPYARERVLGFRWPGGGDDR